MKAVILAGGSGSRLWPLSRESYPKQLFSLDDGKSLFVQTFERANFLCETKNILTVTNVKLHSDIKLKLNSIDKDNTVIAEPESRNTAPAIYTAIKFFTENNDNNGEDLILVLPSDLLINNNEKFYKSVQKGIELASQGYIVTFGVKPDYPESGYGYIMAGDTIKSGYKITKFIEKPNTSKAQEYLKSGNFFWNSGMFLAKISILKEEFEKYCPQICEKFKNINIEEKIPYHVYENIPSISIDYAIMEKTDKAAMVELESDWIDLGSWKSLYKVKQKDSNGNVITGKVVTDNVKNSFIYSQKEIVAVSGLENTVLVETEDAIMSCKIDDTEGIKRIYEKLKNTQSDTIKLHKTVFRPWGYYTCMNSGKGYLTKTICVLPHQKLSIQSHNHRSEHWVVLEGNALVLKDEKEYRLNPGESIDIGVKVKHSLQNPYDNELKIIEVQKGDYLSEDDIIRYEDCYGRV